MPRGKVKVQEKAQEALLNVKDLAARLRMSECQIYTWVNEKKIPYIRLDHSSLRFDPDDIKKWIDQQKVVTM